MTIVDELEFNLLFVYRYYHQMDKFHNILRLLSNEVVHRAIALVGEDILREPLEVNINILSSILGYFNRLAKCQLAKYIEPWAMAGKESFQ